MGPQGISPGLSSARRPIEAEKKLACELVVCDYYRRLFYFRAVFKAVRQRSKEKAERIFPYTEVPNYGQNQTTQRIRSARVR